MAARRGNRIEDEGAQFDGELRELPAVEPAQILGIVDLLEKGVGIHGSEGILTPAVHDEIRDLAQARSALAEGCQRRFRVLKQLEREALRLREAHEARVGRLAPGPVLARGLAERLGIAFLVEDVVNYLDS